MNSTAAPRGPSAFGAFIRLMLSVEDSTRRTAAALETLRAEREPA